MKFFTALILCATTLQPAAAQSLRGSPPTIGCNSKFQAFTCPSGFVAVFNADDCQWFCSEAPPSNERDQTDESSPGMFNPNKKPTHIVTYGGRASNTSINPTTSTQTQPTLGGSLTPPATTATRTVAYNPPSVTEPTLQDQALACPEHYVLIYNKLKNDHQCVRRPDIQCPEGEGLIFDPKQQRFYCGK